jgi:hypothetical protein
LTAAGKRQTEDVYVAAYSDEKIMRKMEEQLSQLQDKVQEAKNKASTLNYVHSKIINITYD